MVKNILIVYAHQEPKSFNGALKDVAIETLECQGHRVVISDLYEMGFDASASKHNFKGRRSAVDATFPCTCSHYATYTCTLTVIAGSIIFGVYRNLYRMRVCFMIITVCFNKTLKSCQS